MQPTHIGRYRVLSLLGAGGMGQVFLAEDTALGRRVALKVLYPDQAAGDDRGRRLTQEARLAAALNHPNIAQIFEIADQTPTRGLRTGRAIHVEPKRHVRGGDRLATSDVFAPRRQTKNALHSPTLATPDRPSERHQPAQETAVANLVYPELIKLSQTLARALSVDAVNQLGREAGQAKRLRTVTPHRLFLALVSTLGSGRVESLADLRRAFNH